MLKESKRKYEKWRMYAKIRRKNKSNDRYLGEGISAAVLKVRIFYFFLGWYAAVTMVSRS